ncbi:Peptidyl-prolyl cis-trans isomerase CWC27 like protein [Eufriesea mexicana]|uniref:Peptidyl-prolyl cis-trans isomerase CWC27 like protein n=1 Tax=Eufriesea mexicana TaxID=516756 RepID=A0A310SFK8_9HYME|nr:Peptidyl-prolyl cis-trans isomerase CWC27 like protein [Eufriesea mexicana]
MWGMMYLLYSGLAIRVIFRTGISGGDIMTDKKVVMKTTVDDMDLELWAKETPKACKNFIQLGMEGQISYKITFLSTRFNCCGRDDSDSHFFFTLNSTADLQNKHTTCGKVTGETLYNMLKLEEALVDENDRLLYPPRLLKSIILNNPFADIIPRIIVPENEVKDSSKTETVAVKNLNLLPFGEEESAILDKRSSGKSKSAHDRLSGSKLRS